MRNTNRLMVSALVTIALLILAVAIVNGQKARSTSAGVSVAQQPLFSEYKGIRLGMTTQQVRSQVGAPTLKNDDQDYYSFSDAESAQFCYDASHKVVTISIDYTGAAAPDYRNIVGPTVDQMTDGSLYKMVRYQARGFWVSYNRNIGTPTIVTITIQKIF